MQKIQEIAKKKNKCYVKRDKPEIVIPLKEMESILKEYRKGGVKSENRTQYCGTCKYCVHEDIDDSYACARPTSKHFADWIEYFDYCEEYEEKENV